MYGWMYLSHKHVNFNNYFNDTFSYIPTSNNLATLLRDYDLERAFN